MATTDRAILLESRLILPINTLLDGSYRIVRVVGTGGFGITYEAEDVNLATMVAVKEYYPHDFGDRDGTMSVRPKSERHKKTFEWGRNNFLQEARTLARFEHPSIVRVTRVFEANSTAYMVMRFEQGQSFETWLKRLGRPPTQDELDSIFAPLLDALQVLHASNFLHRDIAPDNIIIRTDGSPVLLDFGSARRAVAEMSRALTGIVKAGYSPHEQYSSDGRLQGPWTDMYALGGTLYRAVTGGPPEEVTLRFDKDQMPPAVQAAKGRYRPGFLKAIDACLKVRQSERPQSIAQLGPMLLGPKWQPRRTGRIGGTDRIATERSASTKTRFDIGQVTARLEQLGATWRAKWAERSGRPNKIATGPLPAGKKMPFDIGQVQRHWPAVAVIAAVLVVLYGGYEFFSESTSVSGGVDQAASEESRRRATELAAQRQTALEAQERERRQEEEDARQQKQAALEAQERQRQQEEEIARQRQQAEAAEQRRMAALEEARRSEERRREDERLRLAAIPDDEARAEFVRKVQQVLKRARCYDGALNGSSSDAQEGLDRLVANAGKRGNAKLPRIELAKCTVGDFEAWLKDANELKGVICAAAEKQQKQPPRQTPPRQSPRPAPSGGMQIQGIQ